MWVTKSWMLAVMICLCGHKATARQIGEAAQKDSVALMQRLQVARASLNDAGAVKQCYQMAGYRMLWNRDTCRYQLFRLVEEAARYGLTPVNYKHDTLASADSLDTDIALTDRAIHVLRDIACATAPEPVGYNGIHYQPGYPDISFPLVQALDTGDLYRLVSNLEPAITEYKALKQALQQYLGMPPDSILKQLHKPVAAAIADINASLYTCRWMQQLTQGSCIVVNIPSATLALYEQGQCILSSKVIVGKPATPSSTLLSRVTEIVLYPYWTVPHKIATREFLPLIRKDPSWIRKNGFQVLDAKGRLIDDAAVHWSQYHAGYFPFTLRQSTGCDNSLGIIKFNFDSPYGIYLHDTPWKALFMAPARYFSHGCIRVEKADSLARYVLQQDTVKMDAVLAGGDSLNTVPTVLKVNRQINVLFIYQMAWTTAEGVVRIFPDVYRRYPTKQ